MATSLSLYVHIPWCIKKCPYCDFNSHALSADGGLDPDLVETYVNQLITDLHADLEDFGLSPSTHSIFIGGGTPSLLPVRSLDRLFKAINAVAPIGADAEITLEANPNSADQSRLRGYRQAGVNRLSLGVQSFDDRSLTHLGRLHDSAEAKRAIDAARAAGFSNINIDLMFGLPHQTLPMALADLDQALDFSPEHLSWYQLTIEPNTVFFNRPPHQPSHDALADISSAGRALLEQSGFNRYEVSAFAKPGRECRHNLHYWQFDDYLAIGAGAHGKVSDHEFIQRTQKTRAPGDYLKAPNRQIRTVSGHDLVTEYLLNALRLSRGFTLAHFEKKTGQSASQLRPALERCEQLTLLTLRNEHVLLTEFGYDHLDSLLAQLTEN